MVAGEWQVEVRAPTHHAAPRRQVVEAGHGSVQGVRDATTSLRPDAASRALLPTTLPPTFQTSVAVMKLIVK